MHTQAYSSRGIYKKERKVISERTRQQELCVSTSHWLHCYC
uniref:Uncharacterized protein n=1 Tax=Arundo donax TaxID=35708 RepID=A0A0A9BNT1_ARUDO